MGESIQTKKKQLLDKLFYEIGKQKYDFDICSLSLNKEGITISTKWKKYKDVCFDVEKNKVYFKKANCRQILPIEIGIDLDSEEAILDIENIIKKLEDNGFFYFAYKTGSKGYHIHLFFNEQIKEKDKEKFILIFKGDIIKKSNRNMIALEEYPHWKTGNVKTLFKKKEGTNKQSFLKKFLENYVPEEYLKILKNKNLFNNINKEFNKKIVGEEISRMAIFLSLCSIWLKKSDSMLHTFLSSISSSGKSFLGRRIISLFPTDKVIYRSKISAEVFTYWHANEDDWSWDGKILYLEDIRQDLLDSSTFKVMLSEGSTATVTRNQKSIDLEINGKPLILLTTASTNPSDEIINRFQIISLDETEAQTKKITENIASQIIEEEYDYFIKKSLEFLKEESVFVPYAINIYSYLSTNNFFKDVRMRRDFTKLLDLIKCSTILHQFQRKKDKEGRLIATKKDYAIARECINYVETNTFLGLTHNLKKAFDYCKNYCNEKGSFNAREILTRYPFVSYQMWFDYLGELSRRNLLRTSLKKIEDSYKPVTYYEMIERKSFCLPDYKTLIKEYKSGIK